MIAFRHHTIFLFSSVIEKQKNICYKAREKCKAIINSDIIDSEFQQDENKWPKFLDCEDTNIFHESHVFLEIQEQENDTSCQTLEDLKDSPSSDQSYNSISDHESRWSHRFNHTKGQCFYPYLLPSNESYYDGIEGCDLNCKSPQFTSDERENTMSIICIGIREIGKLNEAEELNKCEINYSWKMFHRIILKSLINL